MNKFSQQIYIVRPKKYPLFLVKRSALTLHSRSQLFVVVVVGIINTSPKRGAGFLYEMEEKTTEAEQREVWSILELPQTRRGTRRGKRSAAGFKLHYTWSLSPDTMSAIRAFSPATSPPPDVISTFSTVYPYHEIIPLPPSLVREFKFEYFIEQTYETLLRATIRLELAHHSQKGSRIIVNLTKLISNASATRQS